MAFANAPKTSHVQILKSKQLYQIPPKLQNNEVQFHVCEHAHGRSYLIQNTTVMMHLSVHHRNCTSVCQTRKVESEL